jgi:hypothetical protein
MMFLCGIGIVVNLTRRYPHDVNSVADHVGGALLALWSFRH